MITPTIPEARAIMRETDNEQLRNMTWAWLQAQADLKAILRQSGTVDRLRIYTTLQARQQQDVHTHDWQPSAVWPDRDECAGCPAQRRHPQTSAA